MGSQRRPDVQVTDVRLPGVDDVDVAAGRGDGTPFVHTPDAATVLAFRTTIARPEELIVVGPRSRGSYHPDLVGVPCVRLRLRPGGARAVLGVPVSELADRVVPLADLWGSAADRLTAELAGADTVEGLRRIGAALSERAEPAGNRLLEVAMRHLETPARLAERVGVGERHLRNLFAREVGLSPKQYARIARLRKILAGAGRDRWTVLADGAGYFDQAHMISDFRSLMGVSPGAFVAGRLPRPTPCAGLSTGFARR